MTHRTQGCDILTARSSNIADPKLINKKKKKKLNENFFFIYIYIKGVVEIKRHVAHVHKKYCNEKLNLINL